MGIALDELKGIALGYEDVTRKLHLTLFVAYSDILIYAVLQQEENPDDCQWDEFLEGYGTVLVTPDMAIGMDVRFTEYWKNWLKR